MPGRTWYDRVRMARLLTGLLLATLTAGSATAQEAELPVEIDVLEMVNLPAQAPTLTVRSQGVVRGVQVYVKEAGRVVARRSFKRLGKGARQQLRWKAAPGVHEYVVEVSGRVDQRGAKVAVDAVVTVMRPLKVKLDKRDVDLEARRITFAMNNPAGSAQLRIEGNNGRLLYEGTTDLTGSAPGFTLAVTWPPLKFPVGRMELRVLDASESWEGFELLPFAVDIPHEDVEFETARWEIREGERPKLDEAHGRILEAIREHGQDLAARLYILGHTDTVGSAADNRALSDKRARAIARHFKQLGGITLPIVYAGFGESRLAVKTRDDTDEKRNRRAQYILAAQAPVTAAWTAVK